MLQETIEHFVEDHITMGGGRKKIKAAIEEYDEILTLVKKRKLRWFSHVSRSSDLAQTILQATVEEKEKEASRRKGGKTIPKSGREWTLPAPPEQLKTGQDGKRLLLANSSVVPRRPSKVMG